VGDVLRYRFQRLGVSSPPDETGAPRVAPELAEGLGGRVAAWLSGRSTGRVLAVAPSDVLAGAVDPLVERGHDVLTVALDKLDDPWAAVREALAEEPDDGAGGFDAIAACALLERLPDPAEALRELARHLRPGGTILLSVANIGHWYPRSLVASGRFSYRGHGALAEENLRFFTRRSLRDLFDATGLRARRWEGRGVTSADPAPAPGRWSARADAVGLAVAPSLFTASWLVEVAPG
jgi:SAM-dependent methyltransferase